MTDSIFKNTKHKKNGKHGGQIAFKPGYGTGPNVLAQFSD